MKSRQLCYMCEKNAEVYCLAAAGFMEDDFELDEFTHFSNITALPDSLTATLKKQAPRYYLDYTKQRGSCYFMNHCRCGTKLPDFYLHNNPEGAFYPISEHQAKQITLSELDISGNITISATVVLNDIDLIERNAERDRC